MINLTKKLALVLTAFWLLMPVGASALSNAQKNVFNSHIPYLDVNSGISGCSVGGTTVLNGNGNIPKVFNYLTGHGLPAAAAAGIIGNLNQESGVDPTNEQVPGAFDDMSDASNHAAGLAQWDGPRRPAMIKYAESKGLTVQDLRTASDKNLSVQLDYLWQELTNSYPGTYSQMQKETDVNQATVDFMKGFENPDPTKAHLDKRQEKANEVYQQMQGSSGGGLISTGSCGNGIGSLIVQIALAEVGTHEDNGNNGGATCKYQGSGCPQEWCADFISWVYQQAGVPFTGGDDGGWRIAAAVGLETWFKANGTWIDNPHSSLSPDDPQAPQPGDVVYYPQNDGHVNIVVSYDGKTITTVGGNQSDAVTTDAHDVFGSADGWGRLK